MLVFIVIYIASVVGFWLFTHYYRKESNGIDLLFALCPILNTIMLLIAIIMMLCEIEWEKVSHKFFNVKY